VLAPVADDGYSETRTRKKRGSIHADLPHANKLKGRKKGKGKGPCHPRQRPSSPTVSLLRETRSSEDGGRSFLEKKEPPYERGGERKKKKERDESMAITRF